ncbi:MAG: NADH-quinone oxidoreductase subunit NuoH [Armatimonadetes bacterium]|nr:NADH-quinone oxidoreductase subunit NuoH [Armatimonadota bacterium]
MDGEEQSVVVELIIALVKIALVVAVIMVLVPFLVWGERKYVADVQVRIGPNRVGPFGLLQSLADGIKLMFKEDILPGHVDRVLYFLAPIVMMIPALCVMAVIPFGNQITLFGHTTRLVVTDLPVGILYVLALTSLGVYGVVLAGWASNNKYSLLGGLRSSAQMVSYELPMGLAIVAALMISSAKGGEMSLVSIVEAQKDGFWNWNFLWWGIGFLPFLMYWICGIAETNRAPFDLPEAETELVAGYHTEYSGMKFALFFLAEYANMLNVGAIATTLFCGGWHSPIPIEILPKSMGLLKALGPVFWFSVKVGFFIWAYYHLRATLPRLRYDRLMGFAWKGLVPLALVNILIVATIITLGYREKPVPPSTSQRPASQAVGMAGQPGPGGF